MMALLPAGVQDEARLYDLVVNTSRLELARAVDVVCCTLHELAINDRRQASATDEPGPAMGVARYPIPTGTHPCTSTLMHAEAFASVLTPRLCRKSDEEHRWACDTGDTGGDQQEEDEEMTHATYSTGVWRGHQYRKLSQRAIELALASRWDDAAVANRELLSSFPRDLSALNRFGKALSELGQYSEARRAYTEALEIDPGNNIAKKNFERLASLGEEQVPDG